jgi:hypothetical protein
LVAVKVYIELPALVPPSELAIVNTAVEHAGAGGALVDVDDAEEVVGGAIVVVVVVTEFFEPHALSANAEIPVKPIRQLARSRRQENSRVVTRNV